VAPAKSEVQSHGRVGRCAEWLRAPERSGPLRCGAGAEWRRGIKPSERRCGCSFKAEGLSFNKTAMQEEADAALRARKRRGGSPSGADRPLPPGVHRRDRVKPNMGSARMGRRLKAYAPYGHWKT